MSSHSYRYLLAFGSNLEDKVQNLTKGLDLLTPFFQIKSQTCWSKTTPLKHKVYDTSNHEDYLNFICDGVSFLDPNSFYQKAIIPIENAVGHSREGKWLPRKLDIDVLFAAKNEHEDFNFCTPVKVMGGDLFVPHVSYFERDFWREMVEKELMISLSTINKHF